MKLSKNTCAKMKYPLIATALAMLTACGGGGGGIGYSQQDDTEPFAKATVLGVGEGEDSFKVRAGTDVLISAKDSDGIDDPILAFIWKVSQVSGSQFTAADLEKRLIEKNSGTRLFRVPKVSEVTTVEFELTVRDADGEERSDTVAIEIQPAGDDNNFLLQGAVTNNVYSTYEVVAALNLAADEVSAANIEFKVDTFARWQPRFPHEDCNLGEGADMCELDLNTKNYSAAWPVGLTATDISGVDATTASFNPHFLVPLPQLEISDINKYFETEDREKRIELHNVATAKIYQRISIVNADSTANLIILGVNNADSGLLNLASDATAPVVVDVDDILHKKAMESQLSAEIYYELIDPNDTTLTLNDWKATRGFVGDVESEADFAHAIYINNYDLGFGRDMFMRKDECGNVYSYVENYPTLETAVQTRNNFATVVMEYATLDGETGEECSTEPKFVKFFSYVPDISTGERVRMEKMNFDGRGEKFLPGVCTACHGGLPFDLTDFTATLPVGANVEEVVAALSPAEKLDMADIGATFMPFDMDSFLYTKAQEAKYVSPSLDTSRFPQETIDKYSREVQHDAMRSFNKTVLGTYLHKTEELVAANADQALLDRWAAPIQLINSFYGTDIQSSQDLDNIDGTSFDSDSVLPGWEGQETLYHEVFARYCRACHIQADNPQRTFVNFEDLLDGSEAKVKLIEDIVFKNGRMPQARLTTDRFWVDFDGGESAAAKLQAAIGSDLVPGNTIAEFDIDNTSPSDVGETISMDARFTSVLAESYSWALVSDCGSSAELRGAATPLASFEVDVSPCTYTITLTTQNHFGSDSTSKAVSVNRTPVAVDFDALLDDTNFPYTPGDRSLTIDIDSFILQRGDNGLDAPMSIIINDADDVELSVSENTSVVDGAVQFDFDDWLAGTTTSFNYKVEDADGTRSNLGTVNISTAPIIPSLAVDSVTSTSSSLSWTVPEGFEADSFTLYRDDEPFDDEFTAVASDIDGNNFENEGLANSSSYRYRVSAFKDELESPFSSVVELDTSDGIPSGLAASSVSSSQINLTWSMSPTDEPESFDIFRNGAATALVNVETQSYSDTGLAPNTTYSYEVAAVFSTSSSERSSSAEATTQPVAPTGLEVTGRTTNSISLAWVDTNNGGSPQYQLDCGSQQTTTSSTSHSFTGLASNTTFTCRVRTIGSAGNSGYSDGVEVRTVVSNALIDSQIVEPENCALSGCHDSNALSRTRLLRPCFEASTARNYGQNCSAAMSNAYTLDAIQAELLTRWRQDNGATP